MAEDKLFNYYERQDVLPTFGNFKSAAELEAYAGLRHELFSDKLVLPPRLFRDADVLEFGPDSGENALVFAGWGANMTLAEPNRHAHAKIQAYFAHFNQAQRLRELLSFDVEGFHSDRRFDIIDAEGFIYTVQPTKIGSASFTSCSIRTVTPSFPTTSATAASSSSRSRRFMRPARC